ncbi:MAG: hypothetical protein ABIF09_18335, partial [Gemmatimonadota bacterium]
MIETPTLTPSLLPAAVFLLPVLAGILVLALGRLGHRFCMGVALLAAAFLARGGILMAGLTIQGEILVGWGNELRVDGLSALMVLLIGGIGFLTTLYSFRYLDKGELLQRVGVVKAERRFSLFYFLLLWFLGTMAWAAVTNNIIMLYVAVEATTLTSGLLVAFFWDRRALEAGYKYLMLLTIGITFALFGCVLVSAAGAERGGLGGREALLISEVRG